MRIRRGWKQGTISVLCIGSLLLTGCSSQPSHQSGNTEVSPDMGGCTSDMGCTQGGSSISGSGAAGSTTTCCGQSIANFGDHSIDFNPSTAYPSVCYQVMQYGGSSQPFSTGKPCDLIWANLGPSFNYNNKRCTYMDLVQVSGQSTQCLDTQGRAPAAGQVYRRCQGDDPNYLGLNVSSASGFSQYLEQQAETASPNLDSARENCRTAITTARASFNKAEAQYRNMVNAFKKIPQDLAIQTMRSLLGALTRTRGADGKPLLSATGGAVLDVIWTAFVNMIADAISVGIAQFKAEHTEATGTTFLNVLFSALERGAHHSIEALIKRYMPSCAEDIASMTGDFIAQEFTENLEQAVDSALEEGGEEDASEAAQAAWLKTWVQGQSNTILNSATDTVINGIGSAIDEIFPGGGAVIGVELKLLKREIYALAAYAQFFATNSQVATNCNAYVTAWNQANQINYMEAASNCLDMIDRYQNGTGSSGSSGPGSMATPTPSPTITPTPTTTPTPTPFLVSVRDGSYTDSGFYGYCSCGEWDYDPTTCELLADDEIVDQVFSYGSPCDATTCSALYSQYSSLCGVYFQGPSDNSYLPPLDQYCGDTICNNGEDCTTCPDDCGSCMGAADGGAGMSNDGGCP